MIEAMGILSMARSGTLHRGIDDATNIARIFIEENDSGVRVL
jgi:inhibitor of KinA sporulation pathway (predicted exonuclease)